MKHTNKELLGKGIKYLAGALPLAFLGPSILFTAFNNQEHPWYVVVLIAGLIACAGAIFLIFKGIGTLMKAMFD